jgi:hypothetical protein
MIVVPKKPKMYVTKYEDQALIRTINLAEFDQNVEILTGELIENLSAFVVICSKKFKCAVVNSWKDSTNVRYINTGFKEITSLFVMTDFNFFGVANPEKRAISFYHLPERICNDSLALTCDPLDATVSKTCVPNSNIPEGKKQCFCLLGFFSNDEDVCEACHSSCVTGNCFGPESGDCEQCGIDAELVDGNCEC